MSLDYHDVHPDIPSANMGISSLFPLFTAVPGTPRPSLPGTQRRWSRPPAPEPCTGRRCHMPEPSHRQLSQEHPHAFAIHPALRSMHGWRVWSGPLAAPVEPVDGPRNVSLSMGFVGWARWSRAGRYRETAMPNSARGTVADLRQAVQQIQQEIRADITHVQGDQPSAFPAPVRPQQKEWTQGHFLLQCYKELTQHHGHMELTRDIMLGHGPAS